MRAQAQRPFVSPLARDIDRFLAHKRALGCRYQTEESTLRIFDRYLVQRRIRTVRGVTPDVIAAFLKTRPHRRPRSYNQFLGVLRALFRWLVAREVVDRSPVQARPRRASRLRIPVILEPEHVRRLLEFAGQLSDAYGGELRGPTYRTIFATLYALGPPGCPGRSARGCRRCRPAWTQAPSPPCRWGPGCCTRRATRRAQARNRAEHGAA